MSKRAIASLFIKVGADNYEFQQKIQQTQNQLGKLSKQLTDVGKSLSMRLTAPLVALGSASVWLADTQARAEAKVQQAIKSTGGAAKLNFEQLKQYASEIQGKTIFGDERVLNEATAQLLTFTNIAGDNFKRTQAVALDLATVLDGDLKSASIQLGKALNDPAKNLSALSRSGIQFSKEQRQVINHLAETGRLAEAQVVILNELERQYGGQAEARARSGAGALLQLKNSWGDLMEQFGSIIIPMLSKVVGILQQLAGWLRATTPATKQVIVVVAGLAAAIGPALLAIGGIVRLLPLMKAGFVTLLNPITLAITAVLLLVAALAKLNGKSSEFADQRRGKGVWTTEHIDQAEADYNKQVQLVENLKAKQKELLALRDTKAYRGKEYSKISFELRDIKEELGAHENLLKAKAKLLTELREEKLALADSTNELSKMAASAGISTTEIEKLLASINKTGEATGLIGKLSEEIAKLEKSKENATTVEEVASLNSKIEVLKKQLDGLRDVTAEYLALRAKMGDTPSISGLEITVPQIKVKQANPLKQYVADATAGIKQSMQELSNSLMSWAGTSGGKINQTIAKAEKITAQIASRLIEQGYTAGEAVKKSSEKVKDFMKDFSVVVENSLEQGLMSTFDSLGKMMAGDIGLGGVLCAIGLQIAGFLRQVGELLIKTAIEMEIVKNVLAGLLTNPVLAIAVGGGLIALAAFLTSKFNKSAQGSVPKLANGGLAYGPTYAMVGDNPGARVDPEVIAPLSKLKALLPNGGGAQQIALTLNGELKARGSDLVLSLSRQNFKTKIING